MIILKKENNIINTLYFQLIYLFIIYMYISLKFKIQNKIK